ncbi:hypothetical protein LOCC1_G008498 [Lachnellula occidentalis]|uniref:HCP-like protein n=1 Tax=Lachnellula occidentalis TaxID=215460 RepID=A0A8H8U5Q7_9HELO|nr:hypothetical protein LOCC1_G008498 [Lachnellula occidentalis]
MTSLRRSIPLLGQCHKSLSSRSFHTSQNLAAAAKQKPSPRVTKATPRARVPNLPKQYNPKDALPPLAFLQSAAKAGAMDLEAEKAFEFLAKYLERARSTTKKGWEQDLCKVHGVTPQHMVTLSGVLRRCPEHSQQTLGLTLALAASEMGEKTATFELIQSSINKNQVFENSAPMQRLGLLAKKGKDAEAMALLGKVLFGQGKEDEALEWLRKATQPPTGSLEFPGSADALVYEGRILLKKGDMKGAEEAFKKAALELDEPTAYFYLSQLQESGSSTHEVYLLKAASSGVLEAMHNLGALELEKIEKQQKKPTSMADYGMATEWFQVAAADGFGMSMINLALMCKAVGQDEDGLRWLNKAQQLPEVRDQATNTRRKWTEQRKMST